MMMPTIATSGLTLEANPILKNTFFNSIVTNITFCYFLLFYYDLLVCQTAYT